MSAGNIVVNPVQVMFLKPFLSKNQHFLCKNRYTTQIKAHKIKEDISNGRVVCHR